MNMPLNKSLLANCIACALSAAMMSGPVHSNTFTEALTGGKAKLDLRLRYETVDQNNALQDADALTLRTRLGYQTGKFNDLSAYVEMENTTAIEEDYNSGPGGNGKTAFSVVADPEVTEINQSYLDYSGFDKTLVRMGRQRIILDNARFVGNVGWRQNEQTYTGASIKNTSLPDTTLYYAWLDEIKNIFGSDVETSAHIFNASYAGLGFATLTGYGYLIEFPDSPTTSQKTLGIRASGATDMSGAKLKYTAEYATQSDYKSGSPLIDADYMLLELGATVSGITGAVGYEVLEGDGFSGFETPLATKHAFNGWADQFLGTPATGLEDFYIKVGGKVAGIKLLAVYHEYEPETGGGGDYGDEINLLAAKKFGKHYSAGIKYASYDADTFSVDTDKLWIWGGFKF